MIPSEFNIYEQRIMDRRDDIEANPILVQILQQYNNINDNITSFKNEFNPYLDFVKEEYSKQQIRKERWNKILESTLGWSAVSFITMLLSIIGFLGHYFWQAVKADIGLK